MKYSIDFIKGLSALIEGGDYTKASTHLKSAALEKSDNIEAYFAAGLVFRKTKQYDRATYVLESILRSSDLDSSTKRALTVELGRNMFEAGNYTIAFSLLEMTSDREGSLLRARTLRKLGKFEEAANNYKAIAKHERINLNNEIGYCYYRCAAEAVGHRQSKFIKLALKYIPTSRCISMMNIDNNILAGKMSKALVEIERFMIAGLPASNDDMIKFQSVYFDMKRTEELMRSVMKRIMEGSDNPFFYTYAISRLIQGDNKAKANELIDKYLNDFGFNYTIAKASLQLNPSAMLEKLIENTDYYKCSVCGTQHKVYTDACPKCQSFETLKTI